MKFFIIILILAAFLQTSAIPLNLSLILLVIKAYRSQDKFNFYLAFFTGLILGLLSSQNIAIWSILFLILVFMVNLFKKIPVSPSIKAFIPIIVICSFLGAVFEMLIFRQTLQISKIVIETILSIPIYLIMSLMEERFVVKKEIRLKIKG